MVKNYNLIGNDVFLNTTGSGVLSPKIVSASEFADGIASVDVVYDKAESFTISASMTTKKEEKKITIKEQKKEEVKAPEPAKAKVTENAPAPVVVPKVAEKPEKQAAVKEEKVTVKEVEEKKEPEKEKKEKEKFFEITKVSLIEAKNKAMLIINMKTSDGNLEYKDERELLQGKELIKLSMKPAVNKTKKSVWKFKSAFIKEIHIEKDRTEAGVVTIRIEPVSKQLRFDINRVKNSLVVSITNP
jgi:hypothetical protein